MASNCCYHKVEGQVNGDLEEPQPQKFWEDPTDSAGR
jgi:hypothetical protein